MNRPLRFIAGLALRSASVKADAETTFAFYDLSVQPITGDGFWYTAAATMASRRAGRRKVAFVIVPSDGEGGVESEQYRQIIGDSARHQRIYDLLIAAFRTSPDFASVMTLPDRRLAAAMVRWAGDGVYPAGYLPSMPVLPGRAIDNSSASEVLERFRGGEALAGLAVSDIWRHHARNWIAQRAGGRPIVMIALRLYRYLPERNSDVDAWSRLAGWLAARGFVPVIVPDIDHESGAVPVSFSSCLVAHEAAWNLQLRAALFCEAHLVLGVNGGMMGYCWLASDVRSITFKLVAPGMKDEMLDYQRKIGFEPGAQLPFFGPLQKWVWSGDDFETLQTEVDAMLRKIECLSSGDA